MCKIGIRVVFSCEEEQNHAQNPGYGINFLKIVWTCNIIPDPHGLLQKKQQKACVK